MEALLADEENQSRRTFCQLSFGTIYDNAERGQTSVSNLRHFFERQSAAQRKHAETMLEYVNDVFKPTETNGIGELATFEEQGTSIKRTLGQLQQYALALHTQQLVWTQVVDEHVTRPLSSLQSASSSYIQTLENEIVRVNEEYSMVQTMQVKVNDAYMEAKRLVAEAKAQQRRALHEIGVPSFELQRLAARVTKCERALREANEEKLATKKLLLAKIVARDEMAMAVSVAYQRAEEERMDQIASCLQMWVSVERDQLKFREAQLRAMDELVTRLDRSADLQLLIHNRQNPDNMHFQGKALSILEWHWGRELHQAATTTADDPLDEDELDAANITVAAPSRPSVQDSLSYLFESTGLPDESDEEVELPPRFFDDIAQWCATHEGRLEFVKTLNRQRSVDTKLYRVDCFRHLVACFDVSLMRAPPRTTSKRPRPR
ncbi:hypothetical protein SPRG_02401 [Saprolegnia parasitica CBS 223.65]|uniref:Uncharacterized protein n=1 Tax=Saprolegnia parasitica (strain CBS 223.65) TaxID=695850 RepID=A0A067D1V4_SAPPC|nr:hypothetical protein SPRG_02401 [Saprolegnia parasitica CBS 223.65]KDO32701.1 hypothetical protein SPRG_02401 [Saprolegnia parasitica CBS 223.65]|eukprot:XP_012196367.1 hypothetical protein SPRG_02401 [Saprolegnia parasitica CBS 223.65]